MRMDNWVLLGKCNLENQPQAETKIGPTQVKVKVSHVLLSNYDAFCYTGAKQIEYPKTIGRFAIGLVVETGDMCYGVEKGARVYLNAVYPCGKCFACKSGNRDECEHVQMAGDHFDGFMRDFVVCEYSNVSVIPDSVDDLHALCIEHVALAENIFDNINLSAGKRVGIVGGGFFGSILAQVALYHKLVPVVIDNYPQNIERLKRSGAFYAFFADESLATNINNATSGDLCDAVIYTTCCKLPPSVSASVVARRKDLVFGGFCDMSFNLDMDFLFEKNLKVYAVTDGFGYIETAINMLVHEAIDLSNFEKEILTEYNLPELLTKRAEASAYASEMTVLKLIM